MDRTPTFAKIKKGKKILSSGESSLGSNRFNFVPKKSKSKSKSKSKGKKSMSKEEYKRLNRIGCSVHAETDAIKKALAKNICLKGTCIEISRITLKGKIALAKPCSECITIIKYVGIKDIWYTTPEGWKQEKADKIEGVPSSGMAKYYERKP